jgi:hypothetical protein
MSSASKSVHEAAREYMDALGEYQLPIWTGVPLPQRESGGMMFLRRARALPCRTFAAPAADCSAFR